MNNIRFESTERGFEKATGHIEVAGSRVPFTIEQPDWRHFGSDAISDDVIVYLSGWIESEELLRPLRHATAQLGMAAVTIEQPRYMRPDKVLRAPNLRVENVATIAKGLTDMYPAVHLAGHSLGGTEAVRVASEHDVDIKTLTLLGSAGLIATDNFSQVAPRVFEEIVKEELDALKSGVFSSSRFAAKSLLVAVRNLALAANEGIAAATHYVGRHVSPLQDEGIIVANVMADEDRIFPFHQVIASTQNISFDVERVFSESCHNFTTHRPNEVAQFVCNVVVDSDTLLQSRQKQLQAV